MNKLNPKDVSRMINASVEAARILDEINALYAGIEGQAQALLAEFAESQEEVRGILEDAANDAEAYYDERSEKWQEGDRGQAYQEWVQTLRSLADGAGEELELPEIAEIDSPDWLSETSEAAFTEFEYMD